MKPVTKEEREFFKGLLEHIGNNSSQVEALVGVPFYNEDGITIYNSDYKKVLPLLQAPNAIITDPPYPDYHEDEYNYYDGILNFLTDYNCRQLIFWSALAEFPLDYTSIHIWDKWRGAASQYERIFERNGKTFCQFFRRQKLNNQIDAQMNMDILTEHKSQKPIRLMIELVKKFTKDFDLILDPFMGSGSTLVAAKKLGRGAIGIEINKHWCEVAVKRLSQMELF